MKYILDFRPDALLILMEGEFTFKDARRFRRLLSVMMDEHERLEVRLDVRSLDFMDATAMSLMMLAHDLSKKLHIRLVFENAQGQVYDALKEASLYNCLNMTSR